MTTKDTQGLIGKVGFYGVDNLTFKVVIKDVKTAWGRQLVLISPVEGSGEKWADFDKVEIKQ